MLKENDSSFVSTTRAGNDNTFRLALFKKLQTHNQISITAHEVVVYCAIVLHHPYLIYFIVSILCNNDSTDANIFFAIYISFPEHMLENVCQSKVHNTVSGIPESLVRCHPVPFNGRPSASLRASPAPASCCCRRCCRWSASATRCSSSSLFDANGASVNQHFG